MHRLSAKIVEGSPDTAVHEAVRITRTHAHDVLLATAQTVYHNKVSLLQAFGRLTHGAGRDRETRAETPDTINNDNFYIPLQRIMLQTIIAQYDITFTVLDQCRGSCHPVWPDSHRAAGRTGQ